MLKHSVELRGTTVEFDPFTFWHSYFYPLLTWVTGSDDIGYIGFISFISEVKKADESTDGEIKVAKVRHWTL